MKGSKYSKATSNLKKKLINKEEDETESTDK